MKNTDLFNDDYKEKKKKDYSKIKKIKLKKPVITLIIIISSIFVGLFVLPSYNDGKDQMWTPVPIDMTDDEIIIEETDNQMVEPIVKPPDQPKHDFIGSTERVTVTRDNEPIYWYIIATDGKWQGDFSDGVEKPVTIIKEGYMEFQFRCFEESDQMKYFGNFRNLEGKPINVAVLKSDEILDEKSVDINKAVIMEGFC